MDVHFRIQMSYRVRFAVFERCTPANVTHNTDYAAMACFSVGFLLVRTPIHATDSARLSWLYLVHAAVHWAHKKKQMNNARMLCSGKCAAFECLDLKFRLRSGATSVRTGQWWPSISAPEPCPEHQPDHRPGTLIRKNNQKMLTSSDRHPLYSMSVRVSWLPNYQLQLLWSDIVEEPPIQNSTWNSIWKSYLDRRLGCSSRERERHSKI